MSTALDSASPRRVLPAAAAATVSRCWPGYTLGSVIKESQNDTYQCATDAGGRCVARVVPLFSQDKGVPDSAELEERIVKRVGYEAKLLHYLQHAAPDLRTCYPIPPLVLPNTADSSDPSGPPLFTRDVDGQYIVLLLTWAEGRPIDIPSNEWMKDRRIVHAQAAWLARFHQLVQGLPEPLRTELSGVQHYSEVHDNVMRDIPIDPADQVLASDPRSFGLIHGDLNVSNFFLVERKDAASPLDELELIAFDWDQLQRGWFMYDLAGAIFGLILLQEANPAAPKVQDIPEAIDWLAEGYESVAGKGAVDRDHLDRMILLRRQSSLRFAKRELQECKLPPAMHGFCAFLVQYGERTDAHPTVLRRRDP